MTVPLRYILAAIAFGVAALGYALYPTDANAHPRQSRGCNSGCNQPPPPPPCHSCQPPTVIVPPPHVPPPNIVVVNAGARAQASASAIAIAVAGASGDTIIRNGGFIQGGGQVSVNSTAFSVTEGAMAMESSARERMLMIQAICIDATNNPHPASQTFAGRDVRDGYTGEIFRCMSGTSMRVTMDGRTWDCTTGQALWYDGRTVECRAQATRRPCNERSLLRRFGPGEKMIRIRDMETRQVRRETTFNGQMTMDGGVGQSIY